MVLRGERISNDPDLLDNLQAWSESAYETKLLHSNLAFPLLKKLTEVGDAPAKKVFKEEISKRLSSGFIPVMKFLANEGYLNELNLEEGEIAVENLKKIDFSNCNLVLFPVMITRAEKLELLNISNNYISELVSEIGNLKKLKTLSMDGNQISVLPKELGKLEALEYLTLSFNNLKKLPESIGD